MKRRRASPPTRERSATLPSQLRDTLTTPSEKYELREIVGEGTFSVVRKARRQSDKTVVAVKRLKKLEQAAARVRDEIACLRALSGCEHIVRILDCHRSDGQIDIIMPYFEHCDFGEELARGRFDEQHARLYLRGVFRALAHMHERGCKLPIE